MIVKPFKEIKDQVEEWCDEIVHNFFREKKYDSQEAQHWSNKCAEDIIKKI